MPPKRNDMTYDPHEAQDWLLMFSEVKDDLGNIKQKIVERNKKAKAGNVDAPRQNANIRQTLSGIDRDMRDLKDALKSLKKQVYVR
jgi:hypothetical protein